MILSVLRARLQGAGTKSSPQKIIADTDWRFLKS
jgi:hypothetical protein